MIAQRAGQAGLFGKSEMGARVKLAGAFAAREVLRADAAESPSEQPDRAGQGREKDVDLSRERSGRAVTTTRERAEAKRQEKLELVREQVESGSLVIRQMTEEERRRYPPQPARPKPRGRR
jgi:hypothetical protein